MSPAHKSEAVLALSRLAPVIPVLVIEDIDHAEPLARALVAGGLPVLEVTLRTGCAFEAISAMTGVHGARVGAGTVLTPHDAERAARAGAEFAVSPGATPALLEACTGLGLPLLPGAATASEAMALLEAGYRVMKFFPAGPAGGPRLLRALHGPLPQALFCPTGGIDADNAVDYLALPNVVCVGGSWVAPVEMVRAGDWEAITRLAHDAARLPR